MTLWNFLHRFGNEKMMHHITIVTLNKIRIILAILIQIPMAILSMLIAIMRRNTALDISEQDI